MRDVGELSRRSRLRLWALVQLAKGLRSAPFMVADRDVSFICIEALNIWAEFNRSYVLAAVRRTRTSSGTLVQTSLPSNTRSDAAMRYVIGRLRRKKPRGRITRRDEPTWHSRRALLGVGRIVALSNLAQLQAALALPSAAIDDLPTARNFYAHRNGETAAKVEKLMGRYVMPTQVHPTEFLRKSALGRPASVLEDWLGELDDVVSAMGQ